MSNADGRDGRRKKTWKNFDLTIDARLTRLYDHVWNKEKIKKAWSLKEKYGGLNKGEEVLSPMGFKMEEF